MVLVAFGALWMAGCVTTTGGGPLAAPTFGELLIPDQNVAGNWVTFSTNSPPAEVLPTRAQMVRIWFYAAAGNLFAVSLRELDGTITPLTENHGTPPEPGTGYFLVVDENVNLSPAAYTMQVRAPSTLTDPANYDVLVTIVSFRTDTADSPAMVVALRQRKIWTVTVSVDGPGHVTSNPAGIQCGTTSSGSALTDCSHDFGAGVVALDPGSNDPPNTHFVGWSGNCPGNVQTCSFTLDGTAPIVAKATFGTSGGGGASACPTAPQLPGLRWIDLPNCGGDAHDSHPGITLSCDASGYFCCEPSAGANSPRCGGAGQFESAPDCRNHVPNGLLRQPGGCYEVASP
jgi:hypothetical protein